MELCIESETTAQGLSNQPKTKALDKNLASVESVKSLAIKKSDICRKAIWKLCLRVRVQKYLKIL